MNGFSTPGAITAALAPPPPPVAAPAPITGSGSGPVLFVAAARTTIDRRRIMVVTTTRIIGLQLLVPDIDNSDFIVLSIEEEEFIIVIYRVRLGK